MCITAGEKVEEEEEEKVCGQHFAFLGGQLQHAKTGDVGSCLLAPALRHPPPCRGAASRPAAPSPEGQDHQKEAGWFLALKEMRLGRWDGICRSLQGQQWERSAERWGQPWGCVWLPTTPLPCRADVPQQAQHRDHTHRLQAETRTAHGRAAGFYQAETAVSHQGLWKPEVGWFPVKCCLLNLDSLQVVHPIFCPCYIFMCAHVTAAVPRRRWEVGRVTRLFHLHCRAEKIRVHLHVPP